MNILKNIKIVYLAILFFFALVFFTYAQNQSASFSLGPSVEFEQNAGQIVANISGSVSLNNTAIDNVAVFFSIYDTPPNDINNPGLPFTNSFLGSLDLSDNDFTSQNGFFATIAPSSLPFLPNTEYYFVFRLAPQTPNLFSSTSVLVLATTPSLSGAGPNNQTGGNNPPGGPGGSNGSSGEGQQSGGAIFSPEDWPQNIIQNNLAVSDLNSFVVGLLNALLKIGIPVLTVFLVYSGLRLVMARGNEKELADAKKNLLWVIIGGAVLLGAWTIVKILKGTFDQIDLAFINSLINLV